MKRAIFAALFFATLGVASFVSARAQENDVPLSQATLVPLKPQSPPPERYLDPAKIHYQTGPSIAVAPKGRIWLAIMTGGAGEDNDNYVELITSGDGGNTWSLPKFSLDIPGPMRTFDPAMWTDPLGRVWLFWCQVYDFWDGRGGLWAMICDDPDNENAEWSAPRRLCDGVMKDKPLVMKNGDWLACVEQWQDNTSGWHWEGLQKLDKLPDWYQRAEHIGANVYRSTDQGETWEYYGTAPIPTELRTCDEHMAIERKDGSLRMLLRLANGMGESISKDGGKTWSDVAPGVIKNPASRFFFGRLRSGNVLLVKNGPLDVQTDRREIIAYLSEDDGETFPYSLQLDMRVGPSYPDVSQTPDGTIYSVHDFDRTGIGEIILDVFTEDDVKAGKIVSKVGQLHRIARKNAPK